MGETRYTPGPWRMGDHDHLTIVGGVTRFLTDSEGGRHLSAVAVVDVSDKREEDDANARLIAAAPDLLAACKGLVPGLEELWAHHPALDTARAVIAKAEGRTP